MYPNGSPRQVIRGQVKHVKQTYPQLLTELGEKAQAQRATASDLAKIRAAHTALRIDTGFFGAKPVIEATLVNGSSLSVSRIDWLATLYLGESDQAVATSRLKSDYRSIGGFEPGRQVTVEFTVGFVTGDEAWTTLDVRNARRRRVVLEAIPESGMDYGNKPYITVNYQKEVSGLEKSIN